MGEIGALTGISILRVEPPDLGQEPQLWKRPGFDGYGARLVGKGGGEFGAVAIKYVTGSTPEADSKAWLQALKAIQGTIVTVKDDNGDSWTNCLVVKVEDGKARRQKVIYLGAAAWRAEVDVAFLRLSS